MNSETRDIGPCCRGSDKASVSREQGAIARILDKLDSFLTDIVNPAKGERKILHLVARENLQLVSALRDLDSALFGRALAQIHVIHGVRSDLESGVDPAPQIGGLEILEHERKLIAIVLKDPLGID